MRKKLPEKKNVYLAASLVLAMVEKLDCSLCLWLQLSSVGHLAKYQKANIENIKNHIIKVSSVGDLAKYQISKNKY